MKKIIVFLAVIAFALPRTQEVIYNSANSYYKKGEYKKAINLYKKITKPSLRFRALYNLGNAYAKTFQFQKAINAYKNALKIKKDKDALYNLKLVEKLLKHKHSLQQNKNPKKQKSDNKNKKKNASQNKTQNNHQKKEQKKQNKKHKQKSIKNKKESKKKSNKKNLKIIKESNTTDIRKRFYMNKLKELKFNTLLLPLRSK